MKNIKWSSLFIALLYIAAGVYLFMYPQTDPDVICEVLGIGCVAMGVILIVFYFLMDVRAALFRNDFVEGIVMILVGGLVFYQMQAVEPLVPFILAVVIAGSGVKKLQDGIDAGRIGYSHTWTYLIMAVISIAMAALIMFQIKIPYLSENQLIGIGLAYSGITDLFSAVYLSGKIRRFLKELDAPEPEEPEVIAPEAVRKPEPVKPEPSFEEIAEPDHSTMNIITLGDDYDQPAVKKEEPQPAAEPAEAEAPAEPAEEAQPETPAEEPKA
ncbi:MAG: DUF308 domain-containing protein [Solobacterium sp.]|nr:DUF308 domain-containing protein [Solobacterium sp.]